MKNATALKMVDNNKTNGGKMAIDLKVPYIVDVTIKGSTDALYHRWNCEDVETKAKASKNSEAKKKDNVEAYVYRDEKGDIAIPGEWLRQSIINAAKFKQDPRSKRKSAKDLFTSGVVALTQYASIGKKTWDYLDTRRVNIQRNGVNRTRPAISAGYEATIRLQVLLPEYISPELLHDVTIDAGRLIGIGDFRPSFGRFNVINWDVKQE